jgi:tRNA(fMet)-specific endonuclease VapC
MKYCLDTNTLIYFFKGLGDVSNRLLATPPNEIGIPAVVIFELEVGIGKSTSPRKRKTQLQELTSLVSIIPFGQSEAKSAAGIRIKLEKQGVQIGAYDILIAASALANKSTLVTHNKREFERVEGLKIEDWYYSD